MKFSSLFYQKIALCLFFIISSLVSAHDDSNNYPRFLIQKPAEDGSIHIEGATYISHNFQDRAGCPPLFLVLHYTAGTLDHSASTLTNPTPGVSAHYLMPEYKEQSSTPLPIYNLVPEDKSAFHAGVSQWRGIFTLHPKNNQTTINPYSFGIEVVNYGYLRTGHGEYSKPILDTEGKMQFTPFPETQIDIVIELCKQLQTHYDIKPWNVVGHSDVALWPAPTISKHLRKVDPGAAFPWKKLAENGIGMWPDLKPTTMNYEQPQGADLLWTKKALQRIGYMISDFSSKLDDTTLMSLNAFRLHYQPDAFTSSHNTTSLSSWETNPKNIETQTILYKLITQYAIPDPTSLLKS